MKTKFCCPKCFQDKELEKHINSQLSKERGDCSYCKTKDEMIIEPSQLSEYFEPLLDIHQPATEGKLLFEWLNSDWSLFEHNTITNDNSQLLLSEILGDTDIIDQKFAPHVKNQSELADSWNKLTAELMHTNRSFPIQFLTSLALKNRLQILGSIRAIH